MSPDPLSFLSDDMQCSSPDEQGLREVLGGRVIDVGCGPGSHVDPSSSVVVQDCGAQLSVAVDLQFQTPRPLSVCVKADADGVTLPFANHAFDAALCMHMLEHVSKPDAAAEELARVVRPGGWVLVAVPNGWSFSDNLYKAWKAIFWLFKREPIPHVQRFTKKSMTQLLESANCEVRYTHRIGEDWGWMAKHPKVRGFLRRFTRSAKSDFMSYGWLFFARRA